MRTTVTLDPNAPPGGGEDIPFVVRAHRMSLRAGLDPARLNQMSDELEADSFEDFNRRLAKTRGKSPSRRRT